MIEEMIVFKRYRVWGEYGPLAYQAIEQTIRAKTPENAKKRFIRENKNNVYWNSIGEHNVYVEEI